MNGTITFSKKQAYIFHICDSLYQQGAQIHVLMVYFLFDNEILSKKGHEITNVWFFICKTSNIN